VKVCRLLLCYMDYLQPLLEWICKKTSQKENLKDLLELKGLAESHMCGTLHHNTKSLFFILFVL